MVHKSTTKFEPFKDTRDPQLLGFCTRLIQAEHRHLNKPGDMKHLNQVITQPTTQVIGYGVWPTEWEKGMVLIEYFVEIKLSCLVHRLCS